MCKSSLHPLLVSLPKCEHHIHIEGSLNPELLFELAAKNNISLPRDDAAFASVEALYQRYDRFSSLDDFLVYYYIGFSVLLTTSDFEQLTYTYLAKAHSQNVRHAEVFFDPQPHLSRGIPLATVVEGLTAAQRRAESDFGLSSLLIPCLLRHFPVEDSERTFLQLRDGGYFSPSASASGSTPPPMFGLGLCSSETNLPPERWAGIYELAKQAGVRRTVHAGEEGPASYVAAALDVLGAQRIDHGVKAAGDPALVERLAREGVMLSVCPLSNVRLKGVADIKEMPIRVFLDKGVRFSVNSDDPAYFGGYIQENYCAVQDAFGLSVGEWETIARNTVQGSWCSEERKAVIWREVEEVLAGWKGSAVS